MRDETLIVLTSHTFRNNGTCIIYLFIYIKYRELSIPFHRMYGSIKIKVVMLRILKI